MLAGITFGQVHDHIFFGNLIPLEIVQVSVAVVVVAVDGVPYELPFVVADVIVVVQDAVVVVVVTDAGDAVA